MRRFPTWSLTLIEWLESTIYDAENSSLDTALLCRLLEIVGDNTAFLDEITRSRLLHGDVWLFNLLIQRTKEGPRIVGCRMPTVDRGAIPWRIGRFSCCHGVPARRNRRSSGRNMGNR